MTIEAIEPRVSALELNQALQGEKIRANANDIAENKSSLKIVGDLREAVGGLKTQTSITWMVLLLQTGSMIVLAWALLERVALFIVP